MILLSRASWRNVSSLLLEKRTDTNNFLRLGASEGTKSKREECSNQGHSGPAVFETIRIFILSILLACLTWFRSNPQPEIIFRILQVTS